MTTKPSRSWTKVRQGLVAISCSAMLIPGNGVLFAQDAPPPPASPATPPEPAAPATSTSAAAPATTGTAEAPVATAEPADAKLPPEQLDSLVAPIALYPDSLLAQTLVASTYPLEIVALQQWLAKNPDLKDKALTDAVAKQPWDPSVQAMAVIPDLVKRLGDDIQWTTELGNAFLAQQSDVMDAVQRMRKKAQEKGALETNEQQKVETKVIEEKTVIVVEQSNPEVVYVPSYNPTVVYGPPPVYYSYPPVYYPPYPPPGSAFVSFSVGVMVGAAFWGGGCGWGHNDINIDVDRNFNNINVGNGNVGNGNRGNGNGKWSHNPSHRGAAPYSNKATADKFSGGTTRGQTGAGNRAGASNQMASANNRGAGAAASDRSAASSRGGAGGGGAGASTANRSPGAGARSPSSSGNNIGSREMPQSSSSRSGGFGGGSSGFSGSSARASSSRGASSFGGSRGGGGGGGGGRRR